MQEERKLQKKKTNLQKIHSEMFSRIFTDLNKPPKKFKNRDPNTNGFWIIEKNVYGAVMHFISKSMMKKEKN